MFSLILEVFGILSGSQMYRISRPIRRTVIFLLEILEKNNNECILILVINWKKTGLLHTKISNHNIILYAFFWVIPQHLNFICRRFGTLCSTFIGG